MRKYRARSSIGRAFRSQRRGREFESPRVHLYRKNLGSNEIFPFPSRRSEYCSPEHPSLGICVSAEDYLPLIFPSRRSGYSSSEHPSLGLNTTTIKILCFSRSIVYDVPVFLHPMKYEIISQGEPL